MTERKEGHAQLILKENLLEHLDYEAIPKHIYSHLKKWYGSDFEIIRFMKNDPVHKDQVFLELYPGLIILINSIKNCYFFRKKSL